MLDKEHIGVTETGNAEMKEIKSSLAALLVKEHSSQSTPDSEPNTKLILDGFIMVP